MSTLPRIDGTDELSRGALALLEQGQPLAALEALGLTRDQAKKISRLKGLLVAAAGHLTVGAYGKLQSLGLRAVALASLIQAADWSGLEEILQTVDPTAVKREDLEHTQQVLAAKRARVAEVEAHLRPKVAALESWKAKRTQTLERLTELEKAVQEHFRVLEPFVSGYTDKLREVLVHHLAVDSQGRLCLARRLDWDWQNSLKARGVLQQRGSVVRVTDLPALVSELKERMRRRKNWEEQVYYAQHRTPHNGFGYAGPYKAEYKLAKPLPDEVEIRIRCAKEDLERYEAEIKKAAEEIEELRHRTPMSFLEAVQASNQLSKHDLENHARLQTAAMGWLYEQDHVATAELTVGNRRWDVAGYDPAGQVTIVEAKVSVADFRRDDKWREYLPFADRFYFVCTAAAGYFLQRELADTGAGLLVADAQGRITVVLDCTMQLSAEDREATRWAIARALAKRVVYGF